MKGGLSSGSGDAAEAGIVFQEQVAGVESFVFKRRTVGWNEKPMANHAPEQLDGADGREVHAQFRICGIGSLGKHKPDAIVPGGFVVVAEHAHNAIVEVDGEARKHAAHFGVERGERFEDKCVRGFLF